MKLSITLRLYLNNPIFRTNLIAGLGLWLLYSAILFVFIFERIDGQHKAENIQQKRTVETILTSLFESQARFGNVVYSRGLVLDKGQTFGLKEVIICEAGRNIFPDIDSIGCPSEDNYSRVQIMGKDLRIGYQWEEKTDDLFAVVLNSILFAIIGTGLLVISVVFVSYFVLSKTVKKFSRQISQIAVEDKIPSIPNIPELNSLSDAITELKVKLIASLRENQRIQLQASIAETAKQVSHDIRSPLSALNMMIAGLVNSSDEQRRILRNAVQRINDIANDLLQKSKSVDQGQVDQLIHTGAENAPVNKERKSEKILLTPLVEAMISEKRIQYRDQVGIKIETNYSGSSGAFIQADPIEIMRLLSNLINNSIEAFSQNTGTVTVSLRVYAKVVELSIHDNGKGIPDHILPKLGQMGVSYNKDRTHGGSGLGVYHAKKTVEGCGGKFVVVSRETMGTVVTMQFPKVME